MSDFLAGNTVSTDHWANTSRAFDSSDSTAAALYYATSAPEHHNYLRVALAASAILETYTVRVRHITGWVLQGSNDAANWTDLDTQSGLSPNSTVGTVYTTLVSNSTSYSFYQLYAVVVQDGQADGDLYTWTAWTGPNTAIEPSTIASSQLVNQPVVVLGISAPTGVQPLPMPTFRPEMLTVGIGPLSGSTPAVSNPTLDVTPLVEGLAWDGTTRGGLGGASFYMRQPGGHRSTKTSTNLCTDPYGTATTWWPA